MNKPTLLATVKTYLWLTFAAVLYAIGFNWCYVPNAIGFGGITGIAQFINALFPALSIGLLVFLMNLPLFFLGWKFIGGHLLISSLFTMTVSSAAIDVMTNLFGVLPPMEPILATIYGGVIMGLSLGLVFLKGATTGGTDIIARLLKLKLAWLPIGRILLVIDLLIIMSTSLVLGNFEGVLYGIIALYLSTRVIDMVLYGLDNSKVAYIITQHPQALIQRIYQELDRGVTILHGDGGFSGESKQVLMCAFKQRQIVQLKGLVKELDSAAFLIVFDAHDILGEGFKNYKHSEI